MFRAGFFLSLTPVYSITVCAYLPPSLLLSFFSLFFFVFFRGLAIATAININRTRIYQTEGRQNRLKITQTVCLLSDDDGGEGVATFSGIGMLQPKKTGSRAWIDCIDQAALFVEFVRRNITQYFHCKFGKDLNELRAKKLM